MRSLRPLSFVLLAALGSACDSGPAGSLYDPDATGSPAPVISSISPQGIVLAGIDEITITGQNFAGTASDNIVFFDDGAGAVARGTILAATPTELRVQTPNLPNENLRVRVSVVGASDFSNEVALPLTSALTEFVDLSLANEAVAGMMSDAEGNLYASLVADASSVGIKRFSADGTRSDYFASTFPWYDLTLGTDGELYGVRRIRAMFRLPEGGAQQTFAALPAGVTLNALVTAPSGDIWTAGSSSSPANAGIYRISSDGTPTAFPFSESVHDLVIFDGSLYAATRTSVWRFPIVGDGSLGEGAVYLEASTELRTNELVTAIAFAADGTLFVGTDATTDTILEVSPSGEAARLYPGVITSPVTALSWGPGSLLYLAQPASGDAPPRLWTLETRREGSR